MKPSIALQYILPHRLLSWCVRQATRWTLQPWKNFLIRTVVRRYQVDMTQAEQPDPCAYPSFNAFFTRALRPGARPVADAPGALACPADGRISQAGRIQDGRIFQAKGQWFDCSELLADRASGATFADGSFATIYLSPRDYHRVHMPTDGTLQRTVHVPGRLFSVAPEPVAGIPRLFARNERLICHFRGTNGPFVMVMVGAMLVSGVETVWDGVCIPPYALHPASRDHGARGITLRRGEEMARFNMGSTVIMLLPAGADILPSLQPEQIVRMGTTLGFWHADTAPRQI